MKAENKLIPEWLHEIEKGDIQLPRFQREVVWNKRLSQNFLEAVLKEHPLGCFLLWHVDSSKSHFATTKIKGTKRNQGICHFYLLDGQQRLTTLLGALKDNFESETYYVKFNKPSFKEDAVIAKKRKSTSVEKEYDDSLLPFSLLVPNEEGQRRVKKWIMQLSEAKGWKEKQAEKVNLKKLIKNLQTKLKKTNIPYLRIPLKTKLNDAINIFMNINTSSVKLTYFDIANAYCEQTVQKSLRKYVNTVKKKVPKLASLEKNTFNDMILKIACIDQNKQPKDGNYLSLNYKYLHDRQKEIIKGLEWTQNFMVSEGIWDPRWLPSKVPFRVLPLLFQHFHKCKRTDIDKATKLIRCYIWRSYLTERYILQANDRLFLDYKELKQMFDTGKLTTFSKNTTDTIFNEQKNKLPNIEDIIRVGWPSKPSTRKKSILALGVKKGALGIETGLPLDEQHTKERDYHHVYPKKLLENIANPSLAVNCMMLEPEANRSWKNQWPGEFLTTLTKEKNVKQHQLKQRLKSHTLPDNHLINAKKTENTEAIKKSFENFLNIRAKMLETAMKKLYKGIDYR